MDSFEVRSGVGVVGFDWLQRKLNTGLVLFQQVEIPLLLRLTPEESPKFAKGGIFY
jgi:hypothetical protein